MPALIADTRTAAAATSLANIARILRCRVVKSTANSMDVLSSSVKKTTETERVKTIHSMLLIPKKIPKPNATSANTECTIMLR